MDAASATLLAAALSAVVAAGTFVAAEVLKLRAAREDRVARALSEVLAAIADASRRPWIPDIFQEGRIIRFQASIMRLGSALPARDLLLHKWLTIQMLKAHDLNPAERYLLFGKMYGTTAAWPSRRKELSPELHRDVHESGLWDAYKAGTWPPKLREAEAKVRARGRV